MGATEDQMSSEPSKSTSTTQEPSTAMPPYADWSSSMQAYYNAAAAAAAAAQPFYASTVPSPTPHPYMWPGQHPMMPPYGTPVHYPALYPSGAVYAHPNIATNANTADVAQAEAKSSDVKDQSSVKKYRGISGAGNKKFVETGKAASGSANDGESQSAESGSEGSSDSSDDNNDNQTENSDGRKGSFDLMLKDGANAKNIVSNVGPLGPVTGNPVPTPATNLNIGMDFWNGNTNHAIKSGVSSAVVPSIVMGEISYDERELRKQKRKLSNRESARRSRLRKQAECEELQRKVECLNSENGTLRDELKNLADECMKLTAENTSIQDELKREGKI